MSARVEVVDPGVVRVVLPGRAGNAYLFLGKRIALVDSGSEDTRRDLLAALHKLEVKRESISVVVLTHEHAGHAGGATEFPDALLLAHPSAGANLRHGDSRPPDLELAEGSSIHLGGFSFDVLHVPGHTSGSLCLYERSRALIVSGDTVFARGTVPVSDSGSGGELRQSLERLGSLRARLLLPGHGPLSEDPAADIAAAAAAVRSG